MKKSLILKARDVTAYLKNKNLALNMTTVAGTVFDEADLTPEGLKFLTETGAIVKSDVKERPKPDPNDPSYKKGTGAAAKARKGHSMAEKLLGEFVDVLDGTGGAMKKKEDVHRMAEANKAFAHFARFNR